MQLGCNGWLLYADILTVSDRATDNVHSPIYLMTYSISRLGTIQ